MMRTLIFFMSLLLMPSLSWAFGGTGLGSAPLATDQSKSSGSASGSAPYEPLIIYGTMTLGGGGSGSSVAPDGAPVNPGTTSTYNQILMGEEDDD